jgi:predicted nucleic-acid-binding protein
MIGLDTNVLVRYLTQDDAAQARRANAVIAEAAASGERCYLSPIVLCELTWVLREAYDRSRSDLVKVLDLMLSTRQFEIGHKDLVRDAIEAFRTGPGDFADYLIGAEHRQAGCAETVTFDRHLRATASFRVL